MTRVTYSSWGEQGSAVTPAYAVQKDHETRIEAVKRAIGRASKLTVCACSSQGTSLDNKGRPESRHYQITLGRAVPRRLGGGCSVEGSVWVAIPIPEAT